MRQGKESAAFVLLPRPEVVPTAIAVIRALGRRGIPVVAASSERRPLSSTSRYVTKYLQCPDPAEDCPGFIDWLVQAGHSVSPRPVLYVSSDYDALVVNSYRQRLREPFLYPFISTEALSCCLEKDQTVAIAQAAGVGHPPTWRIDPDTDLAGVVPSVHYPCVVKPSAWVEFDGVKIRERNDFREVFRKKAVRATTEDELVGILSRTQGMGFPMVVQEEIIGPSHQIYGASVCTDADGEIHGIYTCRKTRQYPSDFGSGTMVEGMVLPEVAELCVRICRQVRFHGIAELEFKRDLRDGQLKIIEMNPRPGTWISAAPASGVDTPYLAYCDLTGRPVPDQKQKDEVVRWCEGWPDLEYFIKNRKGDHTGAPLSLRDYIASLRGECVYAYYVLDDLRPCLRRLRRVMADLLGRAFRKTTLRKTAGPPPWKAVVESSCDPAADRHTI